MRKLWLKWLLALILALALLTGCSTLQLRELETKVREAQKELYTPEDAILLEQVSGADHKQYVTRGCIVAYVKSAYGVNRPLPAIIEEYYVRLTSMQWELNPLYTTYRSSDDHIFLRRNAKLELAIYSFDDPGRFPLALDETQLTQFTTFYVVVLIYSEPSSFDCSV